MLYLNQSTAAQAVLIGPFVDSTDGNTAETALTIANTDIRLSKNGGNMAAKNSGGGTHDEAGWYTVTFDATDTNTVGRLQVSVHVAGALPVWHEYQVLEEAVYDDMFASAAAGYAGVSELATVDSNVDAILVDTGTTLDGAIATIDANVDAILVDTGTTLDGAIATIDANVDAILVDTGTTLDAALAVVDSNVDAILVDTGTTLDAALAVVDANVDQIETAVITNAAGVDIAADIIAIKAETASILTDTGTTLDGKIDTIDTNVDAILVDTGTTLQAELDGIQADTEDIQSRIPAALSSGNIKADVLAISTSTAAADNLEASAEVIVVGAAAAGTLSTTQMTTNLTEATNDHYNGRIVIWTSGVLIGQATDITDYAGANGLLTFTAVTEAPAAADTFVIV